MTEVEVIARNVRIQMKKRDVTDIHVAHRLKMDVDQVKVKLNGRMPFADDELQLLAPYLDTTFEFLTRDPHDYSNGLPAELPKAPAAKQPEKSTFVDQLPVGISLIAVTNKNEELRQLLLKTFLAKLTGKIDDLGYYVRNSLLMKVLKQYDGHVSEEEKVVYVENCQEEYKRWKAGLVDDITDVTEVALSSNEIEVVSSVLLPSGKGRLSQFVNWLIKDNTSEGLVAIEILGEQVETAIAHLEKVKKLVKDFLEASEE